MAMQPGAKGDEVQAVQQKLVKLGFSIADDGRYGPATANAVKELQLAFGYDIDGVVGEATTSLIDAQLGHGWHIDREGAIKRALEAQGKQNESGSLAGADLVRTLKRGIAGPDVRYLQRRLKVLGLDVDVDGSFGPGTEAAVRQLQEAFGYTVDGIVGKGTHTLINAQIGHGWKASE